MAIIKPNNNTISAITALPAGVGGKVLQVVTDFSNSTESSTSATYADTNLSLSITPSSSSNKILVIADINGILKTGGDTKLALQLLKNTSQIAFGQYLNTNDTATLNNASASFCILDTLSTTSAITYKIQMKNVSAAGTVYIGNYSSSSTLTAMEIAGW